MCWESIAEDQMLYSSVPSYALAQAAEQHAQSRILIAWVRSTWRYNAPISLSCLLKASGN